MKAVFFGKIKLKTAAANDSKAFTPSPIGLLPKSKLSH